MTSDELNNLLKKYDFGDDWLEDKNRLFDTKFSFVTRENSDKSDIFANNQMVWYFNDSEKYYLLADCNRFHFMWLGFKQVWYTQHGIANPPIGRCYGFWEGVSHNWAYEVVENELVFKNWGQEVKPSEVKYDGKGSVAV